VAAKPPLLLLRRGIETMIEATILPGKSCEAGYISPPPKPNFSAQSQQHRYSARLVRVEASYRLTTALIGKSSANQVDGRKVL